MPVLDQSMARQVSLDLSNMRTPSSISSMIIDLDSSNRLFRSLSQTKGAPGFSNWQNGRMRSLAAKAYDTWLMSPNQERTSVMLAGVGKSRIASRYFLHVRTVSLVISKPANSTVSAPKMNLSGLKCPWRFFSYFPIQICTSSNDVPRRNFLILTKRDFFMIFLSLRSLPPFCSTIRISLLSVEREPWRIVT